MSKADKKTMLKALFAVVGFLILYVYTLIPGILYYDKIGLAILLLAWVMILGATAVTIHDLWRSYVAALKRID